MKWLTSKSPTSSSSSHQLKTELIKPFLVLPLNESSSTTSYMGLKLGTANSLCDDLSVNTSTIQTWPSAKVKKRKSKSLDRPGTATLVRPRLLNENLRNILDMSLITKDLLQIIPNLCQNDEFSKNSNSIRPAQKTATIVKRVVKKSVKQIPNENTEVLNKIIAIKDRNNNLNDNKKDIKTTINNLRKSKLLKTLSVTESENNMLLFGNTTDRVPEPCQTCGRSDQPERFHSHPITPRSLTSSSDHAIKAHPPTQVKKLGKVNHRSNKSDTTTPSKKGSKSPYLTTMDFKKKPLNPRPLSTPRKPAILTCYLCGKEFGSSSLHLHEAKCFERWERENSKLPPNLRREPPQKPKDNLSTDEWNAAAWKASQSTLIPCENCGRTFQPDRLEVHQRSCRPGKPTTPSNGWTSPGRSGGPPTVDCYICGRKFGTRSINIHEPQCLKKWHAQNDLLPPNERLKPPVKTDNLPSSPSQTRINSASTSAPRGTSFDTLNNIKKRPESSTTPTKRVTRRTLACYLCGREYIPSSLKIHEPQCLKKWRMENAKLPPSQRRKEPTKPDIVFTDKGHIDYNATADENWKTHISQLVPCSKCSRTFFPDRVTVHENSCKG
ncbi:zinc finger protein 474-like [Chrysoperla carnea]|uniref:zinc finger protein 474-like n=1 Tax=Chrysoperla carnea TaxID=189513 RepID=UPI001D081562|nr:zinc finger protein 474-like [Chrysoperla carnea]